MFQSTAFVPNFCDQQARSRAPDATLDVTTATPTPFPDESILSSTPASLQRRWFARCRGYAEAEASSALARARLNSSVETNFVIRFDSSMNRTAAYARVKINLSRTKQKV